MREPLRNLALRLLVAGARDAMGRFEPRSGRFIDVPDELAPDTPQDAEVGWAVVHQDAILALCYLWKLKHPDNPYFSDDIVLTAAIRGGDALVEFQNDDGSFEFVRNDGSRWGAMYLPWTTYHWLETFALVREHLDAARRQQWCKCLVKACEGVRAHLWRYGANNIAAWYAATLVRAAQVLARPEFEVPGRRAIATICGAQRPGGFWPELGGPSPYYNLVYVHALGLYHAFTADSTVLPYLERAAEFHALFSYPDSTAVETVDGRVGYRAYCPSTGLLGLSLCHEGRALVRRRLKAIESHGAWRAGLAQLACAAMWLEEGAELESAFGSSNVSAQWRDTTVVQRLGPWFSTLSAWIAPTRSSRWSLDRQSFVSLWHADVGLLVGGGNSKNAPGLSSFSIDEFPELVVPTSARVVEGGRSIELHYGEALCSLTIELQDDRARIVATASMAAQFRLPIRIRPGQTLSISHGVGFEATVASFRYVREAPHERIQFGAAMFVMNGPYSIEWPVRPYNPYASDGFSPLADACAVLCCPLCPTHAAAIEINVATNITCLAT